MEITKGKISIRQAYIILILALTAPSLRVIPNYVSRIAEECGWIAPFIAVIPGILLILLLNSLFRKNKEFGLYEVFKKIFGSVLSKLICVVYIVWMLILSAIYVRFFCERFLGTLLYNANMKALLILILIFVGIAATKKIETFARLSEILLLFFIVLFGLVTFAIIPEVKVQNLLPVTYYDAGKILESSLPMIALFSYVTPLMLLGDKITHKEKMLTHGRKTVYIVMFFFFLLIISTVGLFGYSVNQQFIFPYYITLNSIELFGNIERMESLFISTWVASDFTIILMFVFILSHTLGKVFDVRKESLFVVPTIIIIYFLAMLMFRNVYDIEMFTREFGIYANCGLFVLLPLMAFVIGKVRKVI